MRKIKSTSSNSIHSRQRFLYRTAALLFLLIFFLILFCERILLWWGMAFYQEMTTVRAINRQQISLFMIGSHVAVYPILSFAILRKYPLAPMLARLTTGLFGFLFLGSFVSLGGILTTFFSVVALLHLAGLVALVDSFRGASQSSRSTLSIALDSLRSVLLSILLLFLSLMITRSVSTPLWLWASPAREAVPPEERTAPEGTVEVRRAWGEREYGIYLRYVDKWVHTSTAIKRDVGTVTTIAPLGAPNYYQRCFTDGCHATMRLEVIGNKGVGILELPDVRVSDYYGPKDSLEQIGSATWTFKGNTAEIDLSGELLVRSSGLEDVVAKLEELYEQGKGDAFLSTLAAHEGELRTRAGTITWRTLLQRKCEILTKTAAPAKEIIDSIEQLLSFFGPHDKLLSRNIRMPSSEWEQGILLALKGLRHLAEERNLSEAEKRSAFFLVSEVQKYRRMGFSDDSFGGLSTLNGSSEERKAWGEKTLGLFYRNATEHIQNHPWVIRSLGTITSVVPAPQRLNQIDFSPDGHYYAFMTLHIEGSKGSAIISVFAKEQCANVPPLDIYSDSVRLPQAPIALHRIEVSHLDEDGKEGEKMTLNGERERC